MIIEKKFYKSLESLLAYYKRNSKAKISIFTENNKNYFEYMIHYEKYYKANIDNINQDLFLAVEEFRDKVNNDIMLDTNMLRNQIMEDLNLLHIIVNLHIFFRLFKMKYYIELPLNNIEDIIQYNEKQGVVWYRGQTNTNWQLVPSFFRNAKKTSLWTWNEIYKDYKSRPKKVSLISKLNEVDINTFLFPYKTAAFIQHSIGYSPLIDFTRSPKVALSFALANASSMVNYYGDDACVYVLDLNNYKVLTKLDEIDRAILDFKVQVFKKYDSIINLISNQMWLDLLNNKVDSIIHLINIPTNDRMMFQKGTFILYDGVIIIGDEVFMSYNKVGFMAKHLIKYNIKTKIKENLYEKLMIDYPQYHQRYLLDPYLYLGEPDK
jgi:hypothetical protein